MSIQKVLFLSVLVCLSACKAKTDSSEPRFIQNDINPIVGKNINYHPKPVPRAVGYVNDFEEVFTSNQRAALEKTIYDYEKLTTREIVIVTVDSIAPYLDISDFATDLFNDWAVGKSDKGNGLGVVLSKSLRQVRISTGYGTEEILTDEICKNIIDSFMVPKFKNDKYYGGVKKGLNALIKEWGL